MSNAKQLGKYTILDTLGSGGFATVYRAEDTTLGRQVALKVLDPLLMRDTAWVERFRREARAVAALDHPRIVTVYEIAESDGRLFIAMKLIDGPSLEQAMAERDAFSWEEAQRIVAQVAAALVYAHSKGILHRDLKPGNILLDPQAGAVLTDFGFARLVGESSLSISMSGGLVGTPAYIAPELWHNRPAVVQSDLYALGCILYELLTGHKAFSGETPPAIMMAHFQPLQAPETWPQGTPPGVAEVLHRALAQIPGDRYASAADFLAATEALRVDPLAESYAVLQTALAARNWDAALRLAKDLRAQQPDYCDVAALAQQAQAGWEQAQRVQAAAQWKEQTQSALAADQPAAAQAALAQWLKLTPEDVEAQRMQQKLATLATQQQCAAEAATARQEPVTEEVARQQENKLVLTLAPGVDMVFVRVPAGEFLMGSDSLVDKDAFDNEQPQHKVYLDAYWLGKYPVTNVQYAAFVRATNVRPPSHWQGGKIPAGKEHHPVVNVSWEDATAFCRWATQGTGVEIRLPTEAEWEKAARGADGRVYPWGNVPLDATRCNFNNNESGTTPVGKYSRRGDSPYGCADMVGNVWEWTADWYGPYPAGAQTNPAGPAMGVYKVVRGGSWYNHERHARNADRNRDTLTNRDDVVGFRCIAVRQD